MEVRVAPGRRAGAWSTVALLVLAGAMAFVPTVQANHYGQSCGGIAPAVASCTLTVPNAHANPTISVSLSVIGPPPFTGEFRITIEDGVQPPQVVTCGPVVAGLWLGGCSGLPVDYTVGQDVDITTEARSLAGTGPGVGAWQVTVTN